MIRIVLAMSLTALFSSAATAMEATRDVVWKRIASGHGGGNG